MVAFYAIILLSWRQYLFQASSLAFRVGGLTQRAPDWWGSAQFKF